VLITADVGTEMDDQWTIATAALAEEFDFKGVVAGHAPNIAWPPSQTGEQIARDVLAHLPLQQEVPVARGSDLPLSDAQTPRPSAGCELILEASKAYHKDNRLNVLVLGPATDVASALLQDPTLQDRIQVLGMAFNNPGGADNWNVLNDIPSWQVVLRSTTPVVIGSGEVTMRDLQLSKDECRQLLGDNGPVGEYLIDLHRSFVDENPDMAVEATGKADTWPIWDEVTLAYLLGDTQTEDLPRPVLKNEGGFDPATSAPGTVRWVTRIDADRLWKRLAEDVAETKPKPAP
jgi:purine nucleosidase